MDRPLFGIYVHWPFCAAKCPYCDFNSHVREAVDQAAWRKALLREIKFYAALTPGRTVTSVFFGGGTPSLMEPETVAAVIGGVRESWPVTAECEITLEANPTSVEAEKFQAFRKAGVNRVSLGVQAMDDAALRFMGRRHTAAEALRALEIAGDHFERFSFDLIYARPGQSPQAWREELENALSFGADHMSLYQLTIEKGTPFYTRHQRGEFRIPDADEAGALYETTQDVMSRAGLPAYEISNHALPGQESRHNLAYWRYADYVGIGPGAHGRLTLDGVKQATRGHRAPEIWLDRVADVGHGGHPFEAIPPRQRLTEALMMGLRLKEGVPLSRLSGESGLAAGEMLERGRAEALAAEGLIVLQEDRIAATGAGLQRLDGVLAYLV